MAERAKLRYHGKAYYDEDFVAICKKELKFNGLNYLGYKQDRENHLLIAIGYVNDKKVTKTIPIPYGSLHMYKVGKDLSDLIVNGVAYDKQKLMEIGHNVASLWGGSCLKVHVDKKNKVVNFDCIEHGEVFGTTLEFSELEQYNY